MSSQGAKSTAVASGQVCVYAVFVCMCFECSSLGTACVCVCVCVCLGLPWCAHVTITVSSLLHRDLRFDTRRRWNLIPTQARLCSSLSSFPLFPSRQLSHTETNSSCTSTVETGSPAGAPVLQQHLIEGVGRLSSSLTRSSMNSLTAATTRMKSRGTSVVQRPVGDTSGIC